MSQMIEAAHAIVRHGRSDPVQVQRWMGDHAETLIGQQILVASVHGQRSPDVDLPRVLHAWAAAADPSPTAAAAMEWLKEEHPGLLRAWLLSRVEELLDAELANG